MSSIPRSWALFVVLLVAAFVASLAVPVGAPATVGDNLPTCGPPLLHGITVGAPPSDGFYGSADGNSWTASPWCAAARTQRAAELTTFAVLVLFTAGIVVSLARRRRWILHASEPPWLPAGLIAVILGDVFGVLVGLLLAKRTGTRRMLWTQLGASAARLAFGAVAMIAALLGEHTSPGGGVSSAILGLILVGLSAMGLLTLLYPLTLLRRPAR